MIEALKELFGGLIVFSSIFLLVFLWGASTVLVDDLKNYLKK